MSNSCNNLSNFLYNCVLTKNLTNSHLVTGRVIKVSDHFAGMQHNQSKTLRQDSVDYCSTNWSKVGVGSVN